MQLISTTTTTLLLGGAAGIAYGYYSFQQQCARIKIALILAASAVCLEFADFSPEFFLLTMGRTTQGTVTAVDCVQGKKFSVYFRFQADQAAVHARNAGSEVRCEATAVGAAGTVTYLPGDPSIHIWGSVPGYLGERIALLLFTFLALGFAAFRGLGNLMHTDITHHGREPAKTAQLAGSDEDCTHCLQ